MPKQVFAVTVVLTALVLTACSSHGAAAPVRSSPVVATPSVTVSPTVSPTGPKTTGAGVLPGEKPPVEPPLALEHTANAAMAFAAYYVHALDWSIATSDSYPIAHLGWSACKLCQTRVSELDSLEKNREHLKGGRIQLRTIGTATGRFLVASDYVFDVTVSQSKVDLVGSSGELVSSSPAEKSSIQLFVSWIQDEWQIVEIGSGK